VSPRSRKIGLFPWSLNVYSFFQVYRFKAKITVKFIFRLQEGVTAAELASRLENSAMSEALPVKVKKLFQPPAVSVTFLL